MRKRQEVVKRLAARSLRKTWSACDAYIAPSARPSVYLQKWNCEFEIYSAPPVSLICRDSWRKDVHWSPLAVPPFRPVVRRGIANGTKARPTGTETASTVAIPHRAK